jgi:hypothetical protein
MVDEENMDSRVAAVNEAVDAEGTLRENCSQGLDGSRQEINGTLTSNRYKDDGNEVKFFRLFSTSSQ